MDLTHDDLSLLGLALVAVQKFEFALCGIITHLDHDRSDKKFRRLSPRDFLSTSPEKRKLRRITLGELSRNFGGKLLLPEARLEEYVRKRNLVVHDFWRETTPGRGSGELADHRAFLIGFIRESEEWTSAAKGVISFMAEAVAQKTNRVGELPLFPDDQRCRQAYMNLLNQELASNDVLREKLAAWNAEQARQSAAPEAGRTTES